MLYDEEVRLENYCYGRTGKPVVTAKVLHLPHGSVYFSYDVPIGVRANGEVYIRENEWGLTTGKHLNAIPGGEKRIVLKAKAFRKKLREVL